MRSRLNTLACCLLPVVFGSGCSSSRLLLETEQELQGARHENRQLRRQIEERESAIALLESRLRNFERQRTSSSREAEKALRTLREQKEANADLAKEKVKLEGRLLETERSYEALKKRLQEVQDVAARTAESFADLRLRKKELEVRLRAFEKATRSLREENDGLTQQMRELEDQLKREQAVVRAMKASSGQHELTSELENRVRELESTNKTLREEKLAFAERVEALRRRLSESDEGKTAPPSPVDLGGVYQSNPEGLLRELGSFAAARAGRMLRGESQWDRYDVGLVSAAGAFTLFVLWILLTPFRWRRRRRLRKELKRLRRREPSVGRDSVSGGGRTRSVRQRPPTPVMRRTGFSPILSGEDYEEAVSEGEDPPYGREAPPWGEGEEGEDFGNTKVIPGMGAADLEVRQTEAMSPVDAGEAVEGEPRLGGPADTGLRPVRKEKKENEEKKAGTSNQDLMDELENLIGKKVDEIIQ